MDRRRAAGALLALAACIACSAAAPTASNQTALDLYEGAPEGCYYNFQHYGEGDRIMTNEPCLNCTCHNRMLMCYLRVCPFTKAIGQDCTVEKRADQCCPIVTCPDVPVDLLTSTSTTSPAEYGATGLGKPDKYGCSINGKYFSEGSKVPPTPNKPCEHCYCIRNMTTCVMQECTLHVDGCTPIYHKDVCCPVRYSCDHPEDEVPLLDDMSTTVRPTPGFLLTTTTVAPVTQMTQDCVHDDKIFADGALIKTEKACEHCYCMKGDIVCVVQECGAPMENEGKNCTSLPPREGQCCPDTYICEGDELSSDLPLEPTTESFIDKLTTLSPPRRAGVEGSGYRNEPDETYTEIPTIEPELEGSGEEQETSKPLQPEEIPITEDEDGNQYISVTTKAPTFEHQQTTEINTEIIPGENIEEETVEPQVYLPTTNAPVDEVEKLTTSVVMEEEHFEPHKHVATNTQEEYEKTTTESSESLNTVPDEEIGHKYVLTTTSIPKAEETESPSLEGQKDDQLSEKDPDVTVSALPVTSNPEYSSPSHTTSDEIGKSTASPDEVPNVTSGVTEKEYFETDSGITGTTSAITTEESESPAPQDGIQENESYKPDPLVSSTTINPVEEDGKLTTQPDHAQNTVAIAEEESNQPHLHIPTTTIGLPSVEEETTTVSNLEQNIVTDKVIKDDVAVPHDDASTVAPTLIDNVLTTTEPDKGLNTIPSEINEESSSEASLLEIATLIAETKTTESSFITEEQKQDVDIKPTTVSETLTSLPESIITKGDQYTITTEPSFRKEDESSVSTEKPKEFEPTTVKAEFVDEDLIDNTSPLDERFGTSPDVPSIEEELTTSVPEYTKDIEETIGLKQTTTESILETSVMTESLPSKVPEHSSEKESELPPTTEKTSDITAFVPEDVENHEVPSRIPGEGDCLLNGVTYRNNTVVPSTNNCHTGCRCASSIIKCDPIICSPPPDYMDNCQSIYDSPDSCCPTYVCDHPRETVPPQSDNQMSGTESPMGSPTIECRGDQCEITEASQPTVGPSDTCTSGSCSAEAVQKPGIECGPEGCGPSKVHGEECTDGKCKPESCANGECQLPQTQGQVSPIKPCEGEHCEKVDAVLSPPQLCQNGEDCKTLETPVIQAISCEGESCKKIDCGDSGCDSNVIASPQDAQQVPCNEEGGCKPHDCTGDEPCRRKEISTADEKPLSECEGSDCKHETETTVVQDFKTTESPVPDQTPTKEVTEEGATTGDERATEIPEANISKPEDMVTVSITDTDTYTTEGQSDTKIPEEDYKKPAVFDEENKEKPTVVLEEGTTEKPIITEREGTETPSDIDEKETEKPAVVDEESKEKPGILEKEKTEEPVAVGEEGTDKPSLLEEAGEEKPALVKEEGTDKPIVIDVEGTKIPNVYEEAETEKPVFIAEIETKKPVVVDDEAEKKPAVIEEKVTTKPEISGEEGTEQPTLIDGEVKDKPSFLEEVDTDKPALTEKEGTEQPVIIQEEGTEKPSLIGEDINKEQSTDRPSLIDEEVKENPAILEEVDTEKPAIIEKEDMEEPAIIDEQFQEDVTTDKPVIDREGTELPTIIHEQGTETPAIFGEDEEKKPAIIKEQETEQPTLINEEGNEKPADVEQERTEKPIVQVESTEKPADIDEEGLIKPIIAEEENKDKPGIIDEEGAENPAEMEQAHKKQPAVIGQEDTEKQTVIVDDGTTEQALVEEEGTEKPVIIDEDGNEKPVIIDEEHPLESEKEHTEKPTATSQDGTEKPVSVHEADIEQPTEVEGTVKPAMVNESDKDKPTVIEEETTGKPTIIEREGTEYPVKIGDEGTEKPSLIDEENKEKPDIFEKEGTEKPAVIEIENTEKPDVDDEGTEKPEIIDEDVTKKPYSEMEDSDKPAVLETENTDKPAVAEEQGTEKPSNIDQEGLTIPPVVDTEASEKPAVTETDSTDKQVAVKEEGTEKPEIFDEEGTKKPITIEMEGGEKPDVIETESTDKPADNKEDGTEKPAIIDMDGTNIPHIVEEVENEKPAINEEEGTQKPDFLDKEEGTEIPATTDEEGTGKPVAMVDEEEVKPTIDQEDLEKPAILEEEGTEKPVVVPEEDKDKPAIIDEDLTEKPVEAEKEGTKDPETDEEEGSGNEIPEIYSTKPVTEVTEKLEQPTESTINELEKVTNRPSYESQTTPVEDVHAYSTQSNAEEPMDVSTSHQEIEPSEIPEIKVTEQQVSDIKVTAILDDSSTPKITESLTNQEMTTKTPLSPTISEEAMTAVPEEEKEAITISTVTEQNFQATSHKFDTTGIIEEGSTVGQDMTSDEAAFSTKAPELHETTELIEKATKPTESETIGGQEDTFTDTPEVELLTTEAPEVVPMIIKPQEDLENVKLPTVTTSKTEEESTTKIYEEDKIKPVPESQITDDTKSQTIVPDYEGTTTLPEQSETPNRVSEIPVITDKPKPDSPEPHDTEPEKMATKLPVDINEEEIKPGQPEVVRPDKEETITETPVYSVTEPVRRFTEIEDSFVTGLEEIGTGYPEEATEHRLSSVTNKTNEGIETSTASSEKPMLLDVESPELPVKIPETEKPVDVLYEQSTQTPETEKEIPAFELPTTEIPISVVTESQELSHVTDKDITSFEEKPSSSPDLSDQIHKGTMPPEGYTEEQEAGTAVPQYHVTMTEEHSKTTESIKEQYVTEVPDTSTKLEESEVTDTQAIITEVPKTSVRDGEVETKVPELMYTDTYDQGMKEQSVTEIQKPSSELPTPSDDVQTEQPDVHVTSEIPQSLVTEHQEDVVKTTLSSIPKEAAPQEPELLTTQFQESTKVPDLYVPGQEEIRTETPVHVTESVETDTHETEEEISGQEDKVTKIPEEAVTEKQDTLTTLRETPTLTEEVTYKPEPDTKLPEVTTVKQIGDVSKSTEQTSVQAEFSETTPYLIELEEHTHKIAGDITTVSPFEEDHTYKTVEDISTSSPSEEGHTDKILEHLATTSPSYEERTTVRPSTKQEPQVSELTTKMASDEEFESATKEAEITSRPSEESSPADVSEKVSDSSVPVEATTSLDHKEYSTSAPTQISEQPTPTVTSDKSPMSESDIAVPTEKETPLHPSISHEPAAPEEEFTTKATTVRQEEEILTPASDDKYAKPEEKPSETSEVPPPSTTSEVPKPGVSDMQSTDEIPAPEDDGHFPPSGTSGYGEPDYVEEDQAFGPGTCRYGGKVYVSAQQIPRDDPCDFCFCFRSDIICLQQSCPPPIHGCHEEPIQGFCCPRYECPVSMATTVNVTTTTTTTTTTLPPHFPTHSYKGAAQRRGCQIKGHTYKVGEVVRSSSGPCLHCTCGGDGQMKCDPKACTPEPMLRQMIAAAVSAKRRR